MLKLLSAAFLNMANFINQLLVCLFQAQADYNCLEDSPPKFS